MKMEGEYTFEGPREEVWRLLLDPEVLSSALPGAQKLEKVGENEYRGAMQVKVGPVGGVFSSHVLLKDLKPPERFTMELEGKAGPGFVRGNAEVRLTEQTPDQTRLHYQADLKVGGLLASVGQRLLDSVGKSMARQALENLNQNLQSRLKKK